MKKKKVYRIKYENIIIIVAIVFILFMALRFGINKYSEYKYHQTYEYKFITLTYSKEEANELEKYLDDEKLNELLNHKKDSNIISIIKEKYFIYNYLDRYLDYMQNHKDLTPTKVIALVNTNRDYTQYTNTIKSDTNQNELLLVNKYYYLDNTYTTDLVNIDVNYAYAGKSLNSVTYEAFKSLHNDALKEGYNIIINSAYRSFEAQDALWQARKQTKGEASADAYAARAGFSEHQTGYAFDVTDFNDTNDSFKDTASYQWMLNNAYKYGFILRYPENAEDITGYSFESWHYRYVGVDAATKIHNEGITFDEYYAYYIENKSE